MTLIEAKSLKKGDMVYDSVTEMKWVVIMSDQFKNWPRDCEVIIENSRGDDGHICRAYLHRFKKISASGGMADT